MMEENRNPQKLTESVQFKLVAAFLSLLAVLLILLNTYPITASRDIIFREKESSLLSQASVISSSLAAIETLTPGNVSQVVELLDVSSLTRIIVTDGAGFVLYDTAENSAAGGYALFSEIARALGGEQVFYSRFSDSVFLSRAAMPVRSGGITTGSVYICEADAEQAGLLISIQGRLRAVSLVACIAAAGLSVLFSRALTARITRLVESIRVVRGGNYAHRLELTGNDELTELGDEFNHLTERLEETEAQRRRFVSDASHELKTPLASIRLLSDSIVQSAEMDPATMREFVTDIGAEAERLQRTTEKLLDLSRLDDGVVARRLPVDMGEVARATLRTLNPLADARNVSIRLRAQPGCLVLASDDELHQIIFNLAENAIKYNVEGGAVEILVTHDSDEARLVVEDTGIGIPEADLPHIFARFYRVDKARSREAGGNGLGLSIVHDAVASLGGVIDAGQREEGGSRFTVRFPLERGEAAE